MPCFGVFCAILLARFVGSFNWLDLGRGSPARKMDHCVSMNLGIIGRKLTHHMYCLSILCRNHAGISSCTGQFFALYLSIFGSAGWLWVFCFCRYLHMIKSSREEVEKTLNERWSLFHLVWAPAIVLVVIALVSWKVM